MSLMRGDWHYRSMEGPSTMDNDGLTATFTVPDREIWHILSMWIEYTASDSAATRQIRVRIQDGANDTIMELVPGVTVLASQARFFHMYPGAADLTAARDSDLITTPIPAGLLLRPGWDIVVMEESSGDTTDSDIMLTQLFFASQSIISTDGTTPQASDS